MSDCQQLDAANSKRKNVVKHDMGGEEDEEAGGPSTSGDGAKRNETNPNICSRSNSQHHTESESEEDYSVPQGKLAESKSKVNC